MLMLLRDIKSAIKQMNRISKTYMRLLNPLVFSSLALAVFCRASAGFIGVYDNMLILSGELFELFKNSLAAVYVPALMIELVRILARLDTIN